MARAPNLSFEQKAEAIRLRKGGVQYKRIAQKLGCTPEQARYCWRASKVKPPTSNLEIWQAKRRAAVEQKQTTLASEVRRREIAEAVAEAGKAPLLDRNKNLVW